MGMPERIAYLHKEALLECLLHVIAAALNRIYISIDVQGGFKFEG